MVNGISDRNKIGLNPCDWIEKIRHHCRDIGIRLRFGQQKKRGLSAPLDYLNSYDTVWPSLPIPVIVMFLMPRGIPMECSVPYSGSIGLV